MTTKKKEEKKFVLLDLIKASKIEDNLIISVLTSDEYKLYTQELSNEAYQHDNNPIISKKEFNKIIKRIGA